MGNNGKRFQKMWNSFREKMTRFMAGRYGMDRLNSLLLWVSMAFVLVAMFLPRVLRLSFTFLAYLLMGFAIFRLLSRNAYRRYKENRWLLLLIDRIKDKEHRYYTCPRCRQLVRVPRGKGKISITCPACKEKFIKKT
jgi:hypothetical protein